MRHAWTRAWLATLVTLVGFSAIVRSRPETLSNVEGEVMDWLLDGTDTSIWSRAEVFGEPRLIFAGSAVLTIAAFFLNRVAAFVIPLTMLFGTIAAAIARSSVNRPGPTAVEQNPISSFPSMPVVQTGIFWGLVALFAWWIGTPRLLWQIIVELSVVATVLVALSHVIEGQHWPSDVVGSAIVVALALASAAIVLEEFLPRRPIRRTTPAALQAPRPRARWRWSRT